ncbi:MAG: hypothetical protein U0169_01285 [Polyangiaceae bacterium]
MDEVPKPIPSDTEDVVWALEAAASLWKRGDRTDVVVWIRRAAEAAGMANHDERALVLARSAATFAERYGKAHDAGEVHGGMLDPWSEPEARTVPKSFRPSKLAPPVPGRAPDTLEVLTSAPPLRKVTSESKMVAGEPARQSSPPSVNPRVDLSAVAALADVPDEARLQFASLAEIRLLTKDEEVGDFAFALVVEGEVDVAAAVVDAPAVRLRALDVVRRRGTLDVAVPLRLLGASESAKVALWNERALASAFHDCPWVDAELRNRGDRIQALVGITIGALGERLDSGMRERVTSRLEIKRMAPDEVFVPEGHAIPGLLVVAAGDIVLDGSATKFGSGDFVFAEELLSGDGAPHTAKAGAGGAIVLVGARQVAQELLMSVPPLLEIFAGM